MISPARHRQILTRLALPFLFALLLLPQLLGQNDALASHTNIRFPFVGGTAWSILQGYNTNPAQGGSHYNCDPYTLRDTVSQTVSCTKYWQYRYSLDLVEASGRTAGLDVLAPAAGTVRWTEAATGGISINLGDGYAVALFHVILQPGIDTGSVLQQGQVIGTVAPPNVANNGGTPHIHMTLWETTDGGNWSRIGRPFTGASALDGINLPDLGSTQYNQYQGKAVYSTNQPLGSGATPAPPVLLGPASGTVVTAANPRPTFGWRAVEGATAYQVMISDSIQSPWIGTTNWTSPVLPDGVYTWKVRTAINQNIGLWSDTFSLTIETGTSTAVPAAMTTSSSRGPAGAVVTVGGTGFQSGETVDLRWDSTSGTPLRTITANSSGSFTTQVTIPDAVRGTHALSAHGRTSSLQASQDYEVTPSLSRTPVEGYPGTHVTVTAKGFAANEAVKLTWRSATGPALGTLTTNLQGTGTVTIAIPNGAPGWTDYVGTGQTSKAVAYGAINVLSKLYLYPNPATAGSVTHADAGGIPPNTPYSVAFDTIDETGGTTVCTGTSSADGIIRCQYTVPSVGAGAYPVTVKVGSVSLTEILVVTGPPAVSVEPSQQATGTNITVTAGGFNPGETVNFRWDGVTWQSAKADNYGAVRLPATVPSLFKGSHVISAIGASSGRTASQQYSVGDQQNISGSAMLAPGVYSVFATREGLVGGTTSSGHVIVENDYFVALPACTPSNCKGNFTPGNMTQCGNKCYVKVINPTTNVCRVEPILDTGPWFTVDDWWNPTSTRYLNNLPTNPNILAQGYTAADAARNGLDVGYGLGPNGYGQDNTGTTPGRPWREVGNNAAIDLADGTWRALAPQGNAVGATITVEMLWQTGADPSSSALACGHPLNQKPGDNVSFSPGTANPTFGGSQLAVTNSFDSPSTGTTGRVLDGNGGSNWATTNANPTYATLTLDLGTDRNISGVKWFFTYTGFADSFEVSVKSSSGQTTSLGRFGNTPESWSWYGRATSSATGRFVTFTFSNPNRDRALGSMAEVQIWGSALNPSGAVNPPVSGVKLPITNSYDSPATGTSRLAYDGNVTSNWFSGHTYPSSAKLTLDLGRDQDLQTVRWQMAYLGFADDFIVRVYASNGQWRDLGRFGNPGSTSTWYGYRATDTIFARYVEFIFLNPSRDSALGSIGEVEIWGNIRGVPGMANPSFAGAKLIVTNSFDSPSTGTSINARDGVSWTNWASAHNYPSTARVTFDLGADQDLSGVKWKMAYLGFADQFVVRASSSNGFYRDLGTFTNPGSAQTWYGQATSGKYRFIEFIFLNPNRDSALGSVTEIEIWGTSRSFFAAAADPSLAGQPLPVTCTALPGTADEGHNAAKACDLNGGTNWHTDPTSPQTATLTFSLEHAATLTGVKWNFAEAGHAEQFEVTVGREGKFTRMGSFSGGPANTYQGVDFPEIVTGDQVILTFTNVDHDIALGYLAELEVWGTPVTEASPAATPDATPALTGTPVSQVSPTAATSAASPTTVAPGTESVATPDAATPLPATPAPVASMPAASPVLSSTTPERAASSPVSDATPNPASSDFSPTAISTEPALTATAAPTHTVVPTAAISVGVITNTDGDLVNCRVAPVDGEPITQLAEGDQVDVTGPIENGWYPVSCAGQPGFISADFIGLGGMSGQPTATMAVHPNDTPTTEGTMTVGATPTTEATATTEPTATELPIVTPYPISDTGDTENSGTAWNASDGNPATAWVAYLDQTTEQVRLYLDLGAVLPIDRLTIELAYAGSLPAFEIWLSEDAETWYNVTPNGINGWDLWAGEPIDFALGYDARYLRLVFPNVNVSGLGEIGGLGEVAVWPGDINQTRYISAVGAPTTPVPAAAPTVEVIPTEAQTEGIDEPAATEEGDGPPASGVDAGTPSSGG